MDDSKIVELYRKRDESAVERTMEKYGHAYYAVTYGVLRQKEDAEECVNDTYVKLWEAIPPESPDDLGSYGCRIARNLALNVKKAMGTKKRAHAEVVYDEIAECVPSGESADAIVDRMALSRAISRFLSSQSPQKRMIFMRRYFYMNTTAEIAKILHTTEPTVKMALHRMRAKLKKYLESEGIER